MEVREDDEEFQNPVDLMFEELAQKNPNHFAVRQYAKYKLAAGNACKKASIFAVKRGCFIFLPSSGLAIGLMGCFWYNM